MGVAPTTPTSAVMAVRPELMAFSSTLVGRPKSAAVRALPVAIVVPATKVPSRRSTAIG